MGSFLNPSAVDIFRPKANMGGTRWGGGGRGGEIKAGNVLFNNALNTYYLRLYGVGPFT